MNDHIQVIRPTDDAFPQQLRDIPQPPEQLFVRGDPAILSHTPALAVVGTRKPSPYGQQCIDTLLTPIAQQHIPLISGLAYGIDSLAHKIALDHSGPTIAVLGSGIDDQTIYPTRHRSLAERIIATGGAVISEYPPGTPGRKGHFPARNRIIAGLTDATLVIQAARRSGSLITARLALEAGKDVLAVPGTITDILAAGTNHLIQQGATPVIEPQDIFDALHISEQTPANTPLTGDLTPDQQTLLKLLTTNPQHIDQIAQSSQLPITQITATLTELELSNFAQHVGGSKYVRK